MGIEKYIAIIGIALFIMFVAQIITLYDFMIEPERQFEPTPKLLQFISISIAPGAIMIAVSFILSRTYGSKLIGSMILASGTILLVGMIYAYTLLDKIEPSYLVFAVEITPPLFILVSIPVLVFGFRLFKIKKKRPKKEYF